MRERAERALKVALEIIKLQERKEWLMKELAALLGEETVPALPSLDAPASTLQEGPEVEGGT